jgi:hypothetical protein
VCVLAACGTHEAQVLHCAALETGKRHSGTTRTGPNDMVAAFMLLKVHESGNHAVTTGAVERGGYLKMTVRRPWSRTRCSACQRTARASATRSASRPMAARSSGLSEWLTRATSCSMIGPSSRSAVT